MTKAPLPGQVKTRLCPPMTPEQAAALARACLLDTVAAVTAAHVRRRLLAVSGELQPELCEGFLVFAQRGDGLDERLDKAAEDAWRRSRLPLVIIGMDTPQLTPELIRSVGRALLGERTDAILGPTRDGGFWCIGLRRPSPGLFTGVTMSSSDTARLQLDRIRARGLTCKTAPMLCDVDTFADALDVASNSSGGRFLATLHEVVGHIEPAQSSR